MSQQGLTAPAIRESATNLGFCVKPQACLRLLPSTHEEGQLPYDEVCGNGGSNGAVV
ncbi:hypothetical protein E4U54_007622, partial [Claviceps lovelessii]